MNKFEEIFKHTKPILERISENGNYVTFGGEKFGDIELHQNIIRKNNLRLLIFEANPNACFQCSDLRRAAIAYTNKALMQMEDWNISRSQCNIYSGRGKGQIASLPTKLANLDKASINKAFDRDSFLCLDTCNLGTLQPFRKRMIKFGGLPPNVAVLLNTQDSRHPGKNLALKCANDLFSGKAMELVRLPYTERGRLGRVRNLSLWVHNESTLVNV